VAVLEALAGADGPDEGDFEDGDGAGVDRETGVGVKTAGTVGVAGLPAVGMRAVRRAGTVLAQP